MLQAEILEETIRYIDRLHQKLLTRVHTDGLPAKLARQTSGKREFRGGRPLLLRPKCTWDLGMVFYESLERRLQVELAKMHRCSTFLSLPFKGEHQTRIESLVSSSLSVDSGGE